MKKKEKEEAAAKTKKKKRRVGKTILKVLLIIVIVVVIVVVVMMIAGAVGNSANTKLAESFQKVEMADPLTPVKDDNGYYTIVADRELKIMQITDVHIGGGGLSTKKDAMAINAVASMVTAEKPDLVIVTGDIAYPVPYQAGTMNNKNPAKIFADLMETLGVYWIPVYGNHDTELYSYYSREDISELYESDDYPHCLFQTGPEDVDGCGNSAILIKNSKGVVTKTLFFIDSHSYTDGDFLGIQWKYDNIHDNQVEWFKKTLLSLRADNEKTIASLYKEGTPEYTENMEKFGKVGSLVFFHIPLVEYRDAWIEYVKNDYHDTENVKYVYGGVKEVGKAIYSGIHEDTLFETMQELGGDMGTFCGHDHLNNFSLFYKGIRLTYGYSIDYLAYPGIYKYGAQRGCTLISVKPDGAFDCELQNYYQDKYQALGGGAKEEVDMNDYNAEKLATQNILDNYE